MIRISELNKIPYHSENLAFGKPTWEQHPWPESDVDFGSENAVDGLYTDRGQGGQCTISENKKTTAEWRVDLGGVVSIGHIDIHYRTDNVPRRWCFKSLYYI